MTTDSQKNYLDGIASPQDLKKLNRGELPALAADIRRTIVDVVSQNGGHLASSLGVVELAIAVHYVFNAPDDKIIWDVGHQSYAHKLLTGRYKDFHTLRQHDGLSGFLRMSESPYDAFTTGHSSTSISAGLGMACAKTLKNDDSKVIAIIGDGSMTGGIAFEGLNQTGDMDKDKDIIVILNENDMSISENVGALSSLLSRTFSAKYLQNLRKGFGEFLKSIPSIGFDLYNIAKRSEDSFKSFITPGMLFEALNFNYFGPINGHNLDHLIDILDNIKDLHSPILLHVTTKKGNGYLPAEENPVYFHGVGKFDIETGNCTPKKGSTPSYTQIFGQTMIELAEKNEKVIAVTAAMPEGTGLAKFAEKFPERFFDVGIAEQHGVTFAAGMTVEGFSPVVAVYSTFMQRAFDQIVHDVCIEKLPVVFAMDRGGIVGADGPTHHGLFDLSFLRSLPNMVIMAPKDENELRHMLYTAIMHDGPIALRYPRGQGAGVNMDKDCIQLEIGKGELLSDGDDVLLIASGRTVQDAVEAKTILEEKNISAAVVNSRFIKPLDEDLITSLAARIPKIIAIEENTLCGGFTSGVLECLNDSDAVEGFKLKRIGVPDVFVEHGPQDVLRAKYGINAENIAKIADEMCLAK